MSDSDHRLIEDYLPLDVLYAIASKEKLHPRRYVELVHYWPTRRPVTACRAAVYAALAPAPRTNVEREEALPITPMLGLGHTGIVSSSVKTLRHPMLRTITACAVKKRSDWPITAVEKTLTALPQWLDYAITWVWLPRACPDSYVWLQCVRQWLSVRVTGLGFIPHKLRSHAQAQNINL